MKLLDTNRYYLKGTGERFLHLASVQYNCREFICFVDKLTNKVYIEESTGGILEFIEDDSLAYALSEFLAYHRILDIARPALSDKQWLYDSKP